MVRGELPSRRHESEPQRELELTCMTNLLSATEERVYFKDLQSRFLLVSAGWIAAYAPGRAAGELIGKTDFDVFSDQHASVALLDEQQVIRTGEPIVGKIELETYGGRADTWVSTTKMPLRDERGQIIGTFGISRDVTALIRAENALAQQALQLRDQNESLRELDRLKDEFIGLVSHELRTPLASILGYVEMLREQSVRGPDADHYAEVIERNAQRLLRLVGDLQLVSQIQSGKLAMEFRSADLADIAACAVEELRPEAQRKPERREDDREGQRTRHAGHGHRGVAAGDCRHQSAGDLRRRGGTDHDPRREQRGRSDQVQQEPEAWQDRPLDEQRQSNQTGAA